ncbi:MAG: replicative helicase [Bacillota bacterium]|jgi:replicative DNA helicase
MAEVLERIPPYSHEAEQAILGAVLLEGTVFSTIYQYIFAKDFYRKTHGQIFAAMESLFRAGQPIDLVTLTDNLKTNNQLEQVGGVLYLNELLEGVPTAANTDYYAKIVAEKAVLRRLINTATEIATLGYEGADEVASIIDTAERKILQVGQHKLRGQFELLKDVLVASYEQLEELHFNKGGLQGLATGFLDLDRLTSGLKPSELTIIAARPSMGKTALALNLAQNMAVRLGKVVAIFNLEMSAVQLAMRMLSAEGNIDAQAFRTGSLKEDDWEKVALAMSALSEAKIFIDDTPGITIYEMRAKLRRLKSEHGLDAVVVDYLQLIGGSSRIENRQQEISEISRSLKLLARELDVPVLALSQLSRAVEQRHDKRPMLSDLRESGSIEQDADIVAFIYRDDYYNEESEKKNVAEIIIGKQRSGPVGKVELLFLKNYNKFLSLVKGT